ncbi:hypothetical protein [Rickettsiales endosymbiont of Stachyamoeba lipophora]|uniref:hypothetical protein n=1 Tax=Rickettsiales endosymbiont of Stachyamoeba lipophora TaxID=2486578 RepID=UPI000F653F5E|nr:hypothetical protein [Rickettsiales endosymbiont of Stachyamoeba lipophora]AZL16307.1 hypothetical protein EF513_07190 [Rickettsiales endosymbiont of Stachyamoeba lipophora]
MFVIRLLFLLIGSFYAVNPASAGYACPYNSVVEKDISYKQANSATFAYSCRCSDGRMPNFNLNAGSVKFGACKDSGNYILDLTRFDPTRLEAWYDASDPNGDGYLPLVRFDSPIINYVVDKSGKGRHLVQTNAAKAPTLCRQNNSTYAYFFSKPFLCFFTNELNDKHMLSTATAPINLTNGFTIFAVFEIDGAASTTDGVIFAEQSAGNFFGLYYDEAGGAQHGVFKLYSNDPDVDRLDSRDGLLKNNATTGSSIMLATIVVNPKGLIDAFGTEGPTIDFYLNPYQQLYSTDNNYLSPHMVNRQNIFTRNYTAILGSISRFVIGAHSGLVSTGLQGKIGEIVMFSYPLSHGERAEIEMYLRKKWMITASAPGNDTN